MKPGKWSAILLTVSIAVGFAVYGTAADVAPKTQVFKVKISSCTPDLCTSLFRIRDDVLQPLKSGTQLTVAFALTNGRQPLKPTPPSEGYAQAFDALKKPEL